MSSTAAPHQAKKTKNESQCDVLNIDVLLSAAADGSLGGGAPLGRRGRRRAKSQQYAKSGFLLPLLAAQGCLSVGREELPLRSDTPENGDNNGSGNNGSGGATAGAGMTDGAGSGTNAGDSMDPDPQSTPVLEAGNDTAHSHSGDPVEINAADLLANDVSANNQSFELVRVFGAVNGSVELDGDTIRFVPDEGYEGLASFQYEIRDADGNLSTAVVEVQVGEAASDDDPDSMGGGHGEGDGHGENDGDGHGEGDGDGHGGHDGMDDDDGSHAHPDDPARAAEHSAVLNLVPVSEATHVAVNDGSWFDPNTWANGEVPGDGAQVVIPHGVSVDYDGESDVSIFTVRVDGELDFATDRDTFLEVDTFIVAPSGHLKVGTIEDPVQEGFEAVIQIADNGPIDVGWDPQLFSRGLISHGAIEVHGAKKDSHIRLAEDPLRGDTSIVLEEVPSGWNVGDSIVLTGTKYGSTTGGTPGTNRDVTTEDEELTISRIEGNTVFFEEPLQYDHDTPRDDLKAYVANYTRNVRVITENADDIPVSQRGHVMLLHSDNADVRYSEFTDLGRTDKSERAFDVGDLDTVESDSNVKGRYSLHIHRAGVDNLDEPVHLVGNAVWGSPGWGFVHHDSNAILANNAAYDVFGAAFVAETGNETGRWVNNISIKNEGVAGIGDGINNPKSADDVGAFDLGRNGTGFWFQGRLVDAVDNVAAGSPGGHGFTYFHRGSGQLDVTAESLRNPEVINYNDTAEVNVPAISQFYGNEAIGVGTGLLVVKANRDQFNDSRSVIEGFTAWEVAAGVILEYTQHYTLRDIDVIGADLPGYQSLFGVLLHSSTQDVVLKDVNIDNFRFGVFSGPHDNPNVETGNFYINVNVENVRESDFAPFGAWHGLANDEVILTTAEYEALSAGRSLSFESDRDAFTSLENDHFGFDNLTGTKFDSLGEFDIGAIDRHLFNNGSISNSIEREGWWTLEDGRAVAVFERIFVDRVTGEEIKQSEFVLIPGGVETAERIGGTYRGVLDLDGSGPVGVDDTATVGADGRVVIDVLANDSDPDGDAIFLDGLGEALYGSVYANEDGTITYLADPGFKGEDEFYYWVADDNGNFTQAVVHITVEA